MKILVIYPFLTHPVNAGNKKWAMSQVEFLRGSGHDVYMLCLNVPGLKEDAGINTLEIEQTKAFWGDHGFIFNASFMLRLRYSICMNFRRKFNKGYFKCDDLYPCGLSAYVKSLQDAYHFDACIVNYYWLTKVFEDVHFPKTALNTHDVFACRDITLGARNPWMCTRPEEEAKGLRRAEYAFSLQDEDSAYFRKIAPETKILNVYCHYGINALPLTYNHNLVILSSAGRLNMEGLEWFLGNIFPKLVDSFHDIKLVIGGRICKELSAYKDNKHIELIGEVDDPVSLYSLGDIAINPCVNGTGLKVKTFEALSYGRVAMTHPHSTRGIFKKESAPVFTSLEAAEWAERLKLLWGSRELLEKASRESVAYIEEMNGCIVENYRKFLNS